MTDDLRSELSRLLDAGDDLTTINELIGKLLNAERCCLFLRHPVTLSFSLLQPMMWMLFFGFLFFLSIVLAVWPKRPCPSQQIDPHHDSPRSRAISMASLSPRPERQTTRC